MRRVPQFADFSITQFRSHSHFVNIARAGQPDQHRRDGRFNVAATEKAEWRNHSAFFVDGQQRIRRCYFCLPPFTSQVPETGSTRVTVKALLCTSEPCGNPPEPASASLVAGGF